MSQAPNMARRRRRSGAAAVEAQQAAPPPADADVFRVVDKAREVARRLADVRRSAHEAQVREALVRSELSLALNESLVARADLAAHLRDAALAAHVEARRGRAGGRRRNRLSKLLDRVLVRLGSVGQALVIARSGTWRGTGRALHDLRHMAAYARRGGDPAVSPLTPLFDQAWYLAAHPDVGGGRAAPLVHYLTSGSAEGRSPHPLFDEAWYRRENAHELAAAGMTALEHYVRRGAALGRSPHPAFDVAHYLAQGPALAPDEGPAEHYLREGCAQGLSPHPLFDPAWYMHRAGRSAQGVPPLVHYLTEGWRSGVPPHPLFDPKWYLAQNPDVAEAGLEPLAHFLSGGAAEGRSHSPWFDPAHYLAQRGEALAPGVAPVVDYLQGGAWQVSEARPGFPSAAYLAARPGLVREGVTPLEHWARLGGR